MVDLKPCPFCGEHPVADDKSIWCPNRDCWGPIVENYDNLSDAVAAWNRRASPQQFAESAKSSAEPVAWLGTKDAELARRDMQLEASAKVALDLSAQLAEARKALGMMLKEHDILSGNFGDVMDPKHKRPDRWPTAAEAARRALEGDTND